MGGDRALGPLRRVVRSWGLGYLAFRVIGFGVKGFVFFCSRI